MSNKIKNVIFFSVLTVLVFLLFGWLWNTPIFDDVIDDKGAFTIEGSTDAVHMGFCHIMLQWTLFFTLVTCLVLSIVSISADSNDGLVNFSHFKFTKFLSVTILIIMLLGITIPVKTLSKMYNQNIEYCNALSKQQYNRKLFFDKMWKTYLQKYKICELNKETFIDVTKLIMEGRHDGKNVTWKWLNENQRIPYTEFTKFYSDLSDFVNDQRDSYYQIEESCMEIVREQNTMLETFPNVLYNKVLGLEKLSYDPGFTSTHTENVFETKNEDIE